MKQKLLMLLAVLLTGGMLVACGPGDGSTEGDTTGGVVDEPLATEPAGGDTFGADADDTAVDMGLGGDAGLGTDAAADGGTDLDATTDTEVETDVAGGDATAEAGDEGEVAGGGAAAPATGETVTVVFEQAADGVAVSDVQGGDNAGDVAAMDQSNPDLNLTVGQTYEFRYDGEGDLVFFGSDDQPIFSTAGTESEFAQDTEVNAQMEDGMITFTVTDALAQELTRYAVGPDEQGGTISAN